MIDRLVVGRIVKPHGIRGEVIVEPQTEAPEERFAAGSTLFAGDPEDDARSLQIAESRPHQGRFIVRFIEVLDRNAAENMRNVLLSIPADAAREPDRGRYYPHQLEGLDVVDEAGKKLGTMTGVLENPANDLWVVRDAAGRDVLVPAVEAFVVDVDIDGRVIVLRPIPGLFEEE